MIIFIYGEDTFRSRKKLKALKEKFQKDVDPHNNSLITIDGESASLDKIHGAIAAPSLFTRKRMIIIEKIFSNKSKIIINQIYDYLNKSDLGEENEAEQDNDNIIVFWDDISGEKMGRNKLFKFLFQRKFVQNFKKFTNTETINWVKKEAESRGAKISRQAVFSLTSLLGNDLWRLNNEINKLINFKQGQNKTAQQEVIIEAIDVENLIKGNFEENIFALTDAISNKNKILAIKLFEQELDAGAADNYLMHMIIRHFKILLQVRQCLDNGYTSRKIINLLKLHPFVVQKSLTQARNFSLEILKKNLKQLTHIDYSIKTGQTDTKSALSVLIAEI